jgi:hypothetical protein
LRLRVVAHYARPDLRNRQVFGEVKSNLAVEFRVGQGGDGASLPVFDPAPSGEVDVNREVLVDPVIDPVRAA